MIDTARILQLLSDARWATSNAHPEWRRKQAAEQAQILEDNLAMREIVEALAASDPIILDNGRFTCCHCRAQTVARYDVNGHKSTCRWRAARALIGPASERAEAGE